MLELRLNPFLSSIGIYLIYIHVEYAAKGHIIISKLFSFIFYSFSGRESILHEMKFSRKKNLFGLVKSNLTHI